MIGGAGDDSYYVYEVGDIVSENANEGIDLVYSSVSYTLSGNLENLTLTGSSNIDGTGNNFNNYITGNSGNNILDGQSGNDTLVGGAGNDTYIIDSLGDVIIELRNQGIDTVMASVTYTMNSSTLENLILTGTNSINGTGNFSSNLLIGNSGNNILDGSYGNDTLDGGLGMDTLKGGFDNDTYMVDTVDDVIIENLGEGTDTVNASFSYTLGSNLENLTLTGTNNLNGTGNSLNNVITGNSGNNILRGNAGNDTLLGGNGTDELWGGQGNDSLTGGEGRDYFIFGGVANFGELGVDSVADFSKGTDLILLSHTVFNALTMSNNIVASEFTTITADSSTELSLAGGSSAFLVYNTTTGNLFYNSDGAIAGLGNGGQFAILNNKPLLDVNDLSFTDFA
ncbi:Hemolysin-type calcium-binding region [Rippkaea orientalis PCC 8801]|uniref:Hemolysin-type calcium-binding region n=2 Tax=Rippkaea TaxID=2546365 RepID=B7JW67_RIPO1|nr:calcium-binding protein [Rippkaea orientalis]ACK65756.1 Hemolysin-type calcium-binding region [Rippkaea orientalis PCC 8801]